ncbi:MAG: LysR family transcriptional regulator [Rhodospirillales bacterium 20-60-12]|nr:MAG: LysR family transcriptional regulator [Rhodospirillales bacterium 20-60-12]
MDRLEAMHILIAVVETGSLTAAGKRLGVPLPTVSRKLAELESHLGARLLTRSTRRLDPTESGMEYVTACRRILEQISDAEQKAAGEYVSPKGELVLTAPLLFGRLQLVPIIAAFLETYPEIDMRLALSDRDARLLDDHIDVAVRIGPLLDSSMVATRVGAVRWVVCGSPRYFAAYGVPKNPSELSSLRCVTFDFLGQPMGWTFGRGRAVVTIPIRSRFSVNTAEAAIDAAIAGAGVTRVLSYQAAQAIREGTLQTILEPFEPEPLPVSILHPAQSLMPRKTRSFIDFAVPVLRMNLSATGN